MADPQLPEPPANGAAALDTLIPISKRQRRPSVRLGDIGEQPAAITYEPYVRRTKQWRPPPPSSPKDHPPAPKPPLASPHDPPLSPVADSLETLAVAIKKGSRRIKSRRGRYRRSAWTSKPDDTADAADLKSSGGEDVKSGEDGCREDSESPSPRVRAPDEVPDMADAAEGDAPSEGGEWNNNIQNGRSRSNEDNGVRSWLIRLGLGRYTPVFEIHEVDDDVLPLLTLEDLKDMGINAVGSRRKMYCAIQKLQKGL